MSSDPESFRLESRAAWERAAEGWGHQADALRRSTAPVSAWLVEALAPQPGQTVLDLAAGTGETGLLAAELVRPGGRIVSTDGAEAMVALIRARVEALGLADVVEARPMEAEWIDLPAASVDAVLCRWGYMLLADPGAALRETRRVLRPGGRVALAAWAAPEENPWFTTVAGELARRGLAPPRDPARPGPFSWADRRTIVRELADAGFVDVEVETLGFTFAFDDLDAWWDAQLDLSVGVRDLVTRLTPAERDDLREALDPQLARWTADDGRVELPASTHVAAADA